MANVADVASQLERESRAQEECVFCTRDAQPGVLFETESLYVMPDKFPTRAGHTLIISKAHLPCYAAAPELLPELEEAKVRVERFLCESYGGALFSLEHGVAGQTVFHAHFHVSVMNPMPPPAEYLAHPDVEVIQGWRPVLARYAERRQYRLVEYEGQRYLIDGHSPSIATGRPWFAALTGMTWQEGKGWLKGTGPEDVRETERRWKVWVERS